MRNISKTFVATLALMACSCSTSFGDIVPAPGILDLGSMGDTAGPNVRLGDTFFYGRNSVNTSSDGTAVTATIGANNFDALSIGFEAADNATAGSPIAFAASAGDEISYSISLDLAGAAGGTPSFSYRLNEGNNGQGERVNLTPTIDTVGSVSTFSGAFTIADVNAPEAVDRFSIFIGLGSNAGFDAGETVVVTATQLSNGSTATIPEPSSLAFLGLSALGLIAKRRRFGS